MNNPSPKRDRIQKLVSEVPGITNAEIVRITGASESTVRRVAGSNASRGVTTECHNGHTQSVQEGPGFTIDYKATEAKAEIRTNKHIKNIEEALEEQGVDLVTWEVYHIKTVDNAWDTTLKLDNRYIHQRTNYQFKIIISLRRRKDAPILKAVENLIERIPRITIPKPQLFATETGVAMAIAPIDAHMGKFAWAKETGRRDYGLKEARNEYLEGVQKVLSWGEPFTPERIFYIVGHDLMHVENFMGETPTGHNQLDVDNRLPKVFEYAMDTVISSIGICSQIAPTTVIHVPGNHDLHASLFLCIALKKIFEGHPNIEIDASPLNRKAIQWGRLLVGMTHSIVGKHQTWANELMQQFPKEFAATEYHEWWHGHKHKKGEVKVFPVITHGGVLMRQLTALSPIDKWHYDYLFTDAVPGTEAFLMHKRHGVIANFTFYTDKPQIQKNLARVYE